MTNPQVTPSSAPTSPDLYDAWRAWIDSAEPNSQERIDRLNEALAADVPIRELLKNRDGKDA